MGVGIGKLLPKEWGQDLEINQMTQIEKTAIQQAEKKLEIERKEKLQEEIYDYLKGELEAIDSIEQRLNRLKTEKIAHEENIKNIKQGNLEAIEKRRQSFTYHYVPSSITTSAIAVGGSVYSTGTAFYNTNVAGITVTTSSGKTTIF